jgi:hypothetical protein
MVSLCDYIIIARLSFESIYQYIHLDLPDKRTKGRRTNLDSMVNSFAGNRTQAILLLCPVKHFQIFLRNWRKYLLKLSKKVTWTYAVHFGHAALTHIAKYHL